MLSLIIVLVAVCFLGLALKLGKRRDQSPTSIVPSRARRGTASAFPPRLHESSSEQNLGRVLAYLSRLHKIPLNSGERFFVKTGLSPYYHLCVDDFIPMSCPACEWSRCNSDLIEWRRKALLGLANKLEFQRSTSQMVLNLTSPQGPPGESSAMRSAP